MLNMQKFLTEMNNYGQVNDQLGQQLAKFVPSIEQAFDSIRATLSMHEYSLQESLVYDVEGDELVFELNSNNELKERCFLYVIFYRTDDGQYDIFAEVTDEEGLDALMSEDTDEE
jgi:hypothetical protein